MVPERPAAVCRELTKRFEEVARGTVAELAERFAEAPKGEVTLVLGPAEAACGRGRGRGRGRRSWSRPGSRGEQAAELVSRLTGVARNRLYRASL